MNSENKTCHNCKQNFVIEPDDFDFYQKIAVPPPTWCPECRTRRRMCFRNERALYKRKCGLCEKDIIATYAADAPFPVYCHDCWWSDQWDVMHYGQDYDFSRTFFEQWRSLFNRAPEPNLFRIRTNVNCDFANYLGDSRNCYLSFSIVESENVAYSYSVDKSKEILDSAYLSRGELCYENLDGANNYKSSFLVRSRDCMNSSFLFDCVNCKHCFMSSNLRNKNYVFDNTQYDKEEYLKKIPEVDTGSSTTILALKEKFLAKVVLGALHKYANILKSHPATGNNIADSKNALLSFEVYGAENIKYCVRAITGAKDSYDVYGLAKSELIYEGVAPGFGGYTNAFFFINDACRSIRYSCQCHNSSHLFACIGLRNKQYCILNKQYTKEEYEKLVPRIIEHMNQMPYVDKKWRMYRYGEFFPPELSPFAYNETIAQEYFPLTKEEAEKQGYRWKDPEERGYAITKKPEELPDHIKEVPDSILRETIGCAHEGKCSEQCTTAFKIIPQELQFYRRMNLSLPRLCPNCRHYQRLKQRNPLKLWHRKCTCGGQKSTNNVYQNATPHFHGNQPCPNEFETSYAPDRPEIVYCEQCYNAEVV